MTRADAGTLGERLHLEPRDAAIVLEVLQCIIPERAVWAFGSRVSGRHLKRFSDLDLAIEGKLSWDERAGLSEAFDDSLLPIKVDVLELAMTDPAFVARIQPDFVPVQHARL